MYPGSYTMNTDGGACGVAVTFCFLPEKLPKAPSKKPANLYFHHDPDTMDLDAFKDVFDYI